MKIERFEDIQSWQEARLLVRDVYTFLRDCNDRGFKDQMQRAVVSIMSNIAEGFERGGNKEFVYFLTVSRGSLAEVKSLSYAGFDLGFIGSEQLETIKDRTRKLNGLLNGFISYLKNNQRTGS
ncbi:MAG: four helix bundle protein [Desulfuromonadales bacterium]|nr:four helix bundle protein [Desulfuromonadales bacterium]